MRRPTPWTTLREAIERRVPRRLRQALAAVLAVALLSIVPTAAAQAATNDFVGSATRVGNDGYWLVNARGEVKTFGAAQFFGDMSGKSLNLPIVGMASTPTNSGYWLVAGDGGIFAFGDAPFFGSMGGKPLNKPIVGMASTPTNHGYWMVANDGGIFSFGDAQFFGSMGGKPLNRPIVGMSPTSSGHGYWMVATDGGIFAFGDADFYGSTGSIKLNQAVVGMSTTPGGHGYWLVAADGGIFAYGDAQFYGAALGGGSGTRAIAILRDPSGAGYSVVRSDGTYDYRGAVPSTSDDPQSEDPSPTTTVPVPPTSTPVTNPPSTTTTTKPTTTTTPPSPGGWKLLYQDDFSGTSLNRSYWGVYEGTGNEGVGYRKASALSVGNGELAITGSGDVGGGVCWCGKAAPTQTYGRWEIRYRMDAGNGYGPAVLLWPDSERWPIDGEIDISEIPKGDRATTHFTLHYGANNSQLSHGDSGNFTQWHTYTVEWQPDHITFWLDGVQKFRTTNAAAIPDGPMHLALQNDVGAAGHWIPGRDASTPANVVMHIDYVKIYQ